MTTSKAVKALRLALGDTQQSFAGRMGWAVSTVARYELSRPPVGRALIELAALAKKENQPDLVDPFLDAFVEQMGLRLHSHLIELRGQPSANDETHAVCSCGRLFFPDRAPRANIKQSWCPECKSNGRMWRILKREARKAK